MLRHCEFLTCFFFKKIKLPNADKPDLIKNIFLQWPSLDLLLSPLSLPTESQTVMPGTRCKNSGCKTVGASLSFVHFNVCLWATSAVAQNSRLSDISKSREIHHPNQWELPTHTHTYWCFHYFQGHGIDLHSFPGYLPKP